MANRFLQKYNNLFSEAHLLYQHYSKSYITQAGQVFKALTPDQLWEYSEINSYIEVSSFELFGSASDNDRLLSKIASSCVQISGVSLCPISLHFINKGTKLRLLIGTPHANINVIQSTLSGNLSAADLKLVSSLFANYEEQLRFQKYSGVVVGAGQNINPDFDVAINSLESVNYALSIIALPYSSPSIQNELTNINSYLDSYQVITQEQLPFGNSPRRDIVHDNHDISDLLDLLTSIKSDLIQGMSSGLWQTYISICAPDAKSYSQVYSTFSSVLQPRTDSEKAERPLALVTFPQNIFNGQYSLCLPRAFVGERDYGGMFSNTFANHLTSATLSSLFKLPPTSHYGYRVSQFGNSRENAAGTYSKYAPVVNAHGSIHLGVVDGSNQDFYIPVDALRQHVFITGFTQSGKSTTMQRIIGEISDRGIPFIVIESAKKQYCQLLADRCLSSRMQVYSGGYDARLLQINPFQPEAGTILDNHIQSLVALFVSLFDEPAPLPQIINLLVYKAYSSKGWNNKDRVKRIERREFPTIATMLQLIDEVIEEIRYSSKYPETAENMRGVIRGRLLSIVQGSMNDVLNTIHNISIEEMFSSSSVVELDDFSESNRSFVSGLLALKTYEFSRNSDYGNTIRRLLVIEEAHNIVPNIDLGRVSSNSALCSNHFTSMLAEVAAYGTGLVIIDQRPTAVSPAVIANTGTKIIHNLQAGEDKSAMAISLGLTETETNIISDLKIGQAIVKIPNSSEKCRVIVSRNDTGHDTVNWGTLFLNAPDKKMVSPGAVPHEVEYFLLGSISVDTILNCISFAELRLQRTMTWQERVLYAGELLNATTASVRAKRQILNELVEVLR